MIRLTRGKPARYLSLVLYLSFGLFVTGCKFISGHKVPYSPYTQIKPRIIAVDDSWLSRKGEGGIIAADVNDDGKMDFVITKDGHVAAYDYSGRNIWIKGVDIQVSTKSEVNGLPGWFGPGVQASDVDGDLRTEVLILTKKNTLHIIDGVTGKTEKVVLLRHPEGTERWEHLVIANFRGKGDRDLLLQTTNADGVRMGRYLAAYSIEDLLRKESVEPLWTRDDFIPCAHNGARVADLNRDGKDEVLGGTIIGPDGKMLMKIHPIGHIDSIYVADVRPDIYGLEVVALEEGKENRIFLYNHERIIWTAHHKHWEPQNAAIGDFAPKSPGLEIWCRSRFREHQKPFLFDSSGNVISEYEMDSVAPDGWTVKGVEVIFTVDWTGKTKQLAAAKERHTSGDIAIFDPLSGEFLYRFNEKAGFLYVADVSGDWREELIVINGNELRIYENDTPNPSSNNPRLWTKDHYRRSKMTWNYYSP